MTNSSNITRTGTHGSRQILILPFRHLGKLRWLGLLGLVGMMLPISFGLLFAWLPAQLLWQQGKLRNFEMLLLIFVIVGVLMIGKGLQVCLASIGVLFDRAFTKIIIDSSSITVVEQSCGITLKRKIDLKDSRFLEVVASNHSTYRRMKRRIEIQLPIKLSVTSYDLLLSDGSAESPIKSLVLGYSKTTLNELASILINEFGFRYADERVCEFVPTVEPSAIANSDAPKDTNIVFEQQNDGVTFEVIARKSIPAFKTYFIAFLFLTLACTAVGLCFCFDFDNFTFRNASDLTWPAIVIWSLLEIAFASALFRSLNAMSRKTTLATSHGSLYFSQSTLFRSQSHKYAFDDLNTIKVGPSNFGKSSGDDEQEVVHFYPELKIVPYNKKTQKCLLMLAEDELNWIAWHLRQTLGITHPSESSNVAAEVQYDNFGTAIPPPHSSLKLIMNSKSNLVQTIFAESKSASALHYIGLCLVIIFFLLVPVFMFLSGFVQLDISELFSIVFSVGELLFLAPFIVIGSYLVYQASCVIWTTSRIDFDPQNLKVTLIRPWSVKIHRFESQDILEVNCQFSTSSNPFQLTHLCLLASKEVPLTLMNGYSDHDLAYVAATISNWKRICQRQMI